MSPVSPRVMPSKDSKQAEDVGALLMRSRTIVREDFVSSHSLPMSPVSPRGMPSRDSKLAEDVGALLMGSRAIVIEFGNDSDSIAEASAIAIEPPMHGPHEAWRLNFIDHEQIEPIRPSSKSRRLKVLSECTKKNLKVHKRPAAAINKAQKCKAACPKNTQAAQGYMLMPKTIYHNGKDRLKLCVCVSPMTQGATSTSYHEKGMITAQGMILGVLAGIVRSNVEPPTIK